MFVKGTQGGMERAEGREGGQEGVRAPAADAGARPPRPTGWPREPAAGPPAGFGGARREGGAPPGPQGRLPGARHAGC